MPDKRISALLRGGEKLLKSLHNRLGFELHARAETSEGAQTSLARGELRHVVDQTVRELQESNVDDTITTLMTATTDRLVLVTTPETSDQVRFDIRPLQEFFAAEYLYEDVAADILGKRLEIVAGDAHWHEVMHFLLSAIIENSRQTDLAVSIEKLSNTNDRADGAMRAFYRRLCLGGMIASRLLSEGVLEQDRRTRHQFRRCIEPMFGSTDTELLDSLAQVKAAESLNWLIDVLADAIGEQTENESIGAGYLLCLLLPDGHPRVEEVVGNLQSKSLDFVNCVMEMLYREYHNTDPERRLEFSFWALCWVARMLASPNWRELNVTGVRTAFILLGTGRNLLPEALSSVGFDRELSEILADTISGSRDHNEVPEHKISGTHISTAYYKPAERLRLETWGDEKWKVLEGATGIFALFKPILLLAHRKETSEIIDILEADRKF